MGGQWPVFFRGVTSMYASEIAINHLLGPDGFEQLRPPCEQEVLEECKGSPFLMDVWSNIPDDFTSTATIHCKRTEDTFSKWKFKDGDEPGGQYAGLTAKIVGKKDLREVKNYALAIALNYTGVLMGEEERVPSFSLIDDTV